jgi:UDP-N-acetyl-D-galactosamine dehydrogenase
MKASADLHIVVIGLGYVGLPLAVALARSFRVTGLDVDESRIAQLKHGHDRTREVEPEALTGSALALTGDPASAAGADLYIVTVPTPVDEQCRPDLRPVESATRSVAAMIDPARAPTIVYESTVYPGVTEDFCGPLIEQVSGLKRGRDFFLGYSPERINPGDREHTLDKVVKVVAGQDAATLARVAAAYSTIAPAGIHRAPSIRVAEAAKVIENIQRDVNIALMNELALICDRLGLSTRDVLAAAATKWNFLKFTRAWSAATASASIPIT